MASHQTSDKEQSVTDTSDEAQEPTASESESGTGVSTGPNNPREGQQDATRSPEGESPGEAAGGGQHGG